MHALMHGINIFQVKVRVFTVLRHDQLNKNARNFINQDNAFDKCKKTGVIWREVLNGDRLYIGTLLVMRRVTARKTAFKVSLNGRSGISIIG